MKDGVVYTPENIVDDIFSRFGDIAGKKILEPSCGNGAFVLGAIKRIIKYGGDVENNLSLIYAYDIDASAIDELTKKANLLIGYERKWNFYCKDYLFSLDENEYDIIVGNPPYIKAHHINKEYLKRIKNTFKTCHSGAIDLYYAFIEKMLDSININGKIAFIVSNTFLVNKSAAMLRKILLGANVVIDDFSSKKVFNSVDTYTCIVEISKDNSDSIIIKRNGEISKVQKKEVLHGEPWVVLQEKSTREAPKITNGVATLCDKAFIFSPEIVTETSIIFVSQINNKKYEIEKEICRKIYKASTLKEYVAMYPYTDSGQPLAEKDIKENYPKAYIYLLSIKDRLVNRSFDNEWYLYGRSQGTKNMFGKKVVISPLVNGRFNYRFVEDERALVYSGFFIVTDSLENMMYMLDDEKLIRYIMDNGKKMSGGWVSFSKEVLNCYYKTT